MAQRSFFSRVMRLAPLVVLALGLCACSGETEKKPEAEKQTATPTPPAPATQSAAPGKSPEPSTKTETSFFGSFTVTTDSEADTGNGIKLSVIYNGKDITQHDERYRTVTAHGARMGVPAGECSTAKVDMFTGGANCCFGYYLLTSCPYKKAAAFLEPFDGSLASVEMTLPETKQQVFGVDDPAFMYYEKAAGGTDAKISFSRVESPRMKRFLVFENGLWRADKKGEFPAAYKALMEQARQSDMEPAAKAIAVSYYTLMTGEGDADKDATAAWPKEYNAVTEAVLADIRKAVEGFNPVKNIVLE